MVEWITSSAPVPYPQAIEAMEQRVDGILAGRDSEAVWLLEHPALYTAGTSAKPTDLKDPGRFPVFEAKRGGQYTYHGPGQRVAYVMLDVAKRGKDVRAFVQSLEAWIIDTLENFNIRAETRQGRVGVWVARPEKPPLADGSVRDDKIAALGIRVRRWVSFHGISINVEPDLSHFEGIVPCGISGHGVTSMVDLGHLVGVDEVDSALRSAFARHFST